MHSANTNHTTAAKSSHHRRKSSLSNSLSSSSVVTVRRSASLASSRNPSSTRPDTAPLDPYPEADEASDGHHQRQRAASHHRRRSSLAHVAVDNSPLIQEGVGNLNRWSQSTTSSKSSARDRSQESFSRRLSFSTTQSFHSLHGAAVYSPSPKKSPRTRSPGVEHPRRARPYSPPPRLPEPAIALSPIDPLPLLPPTVFDPSAPSSSAGATPLSQPYSSSTLASSAPDYFSHRSHTNTSPRGKRAGSKPRTQQPAKQPLASPPVIEGKRRPSRPHNTAPPASRGPIPPAQRSISASARDRRAPSTSRGPRERGFSELSGSEEENPRPSSRARDRGEKDKKTMLSRALQKANTAVLLDNAQNFEGAMEAYGDACKLLQQVMLRSSGDDDRRKLEAIRVTYTNRIQELRLLDPAWQAAAGKTLPARPMSNESIGTDAQSLTLDNASVDEPAIIGTATITRIVNDKSLDADQDGAFRSRPARESVLTTAIREVENGGFLRDQAPAKSNGRGRTPEPGRNLGVPMDESYMPPPLSPRRPLTPNGHEERDPFKEPSVQEAMRLHPDSDLAKHGRDNSSESISWLDTIDESGGSSCSSSVHSVDNGEFRRKHLRSTSGATEAEFDAALDAAVEAAYDDHLEPFEENNPVRRFEDSSAHRRNVELAKERVREAEREAAIESARQRERENRTKQDQLPHVRGSIDSANNDPDAEEEERMLDEMTKEYMMDGFDFDLKSKSALPRQSDSSEFSSGSTWHSSMSSARNTAGTSLSTVAEGGLTLSGTSGNSSHVPASVTLPSVDETETQAPMSPTTGLVSPPRFTKLESGVRSRRLSGQNPKQLKIETSVKPASENQGPLTQQPYQLKVDESEEPLRTDDDTEGTLPSTTFKAPSAQTSQSNLQPASAAPTPGISPADSMSAISPATSLNQMMSNESAAPGSPGRSKFPGKLGQPPATIKKNKSSLSLRNRALSVSSPEGSEGTVGTPVSTTFISFGGRKASTAHSAHSHLAQTPSLPAFSMEGLGIPTGGMHLFDSDIHSPYDPGSPNPLAINGPIPLEPCPDAYLLRPFWLMRCFYQTLAHSRGGYLTSKLFIPRDIWGVKGVKIKAVEEKVANCDLLTAALLKLSSVDTYDADAVLEEMQALEAVLDQVQTNLVKKLGSDVGVNGVTNLFKDAATVSSSGTAAPDGSTMPDLPAKSAATSRSYLSSWKKLRSKNSGVGLSSTFTTKEVQKDSLTMPSLPMTSLPNIRFAKREPVQQLGAFEGPNGNYMGALARLCEAVQILDQIARQVEDPGLKHSSPTHVGLELSIRHAAEFFGFYVCRFVLQDVGMMIDKFIKRGSEWVLV